MHLGNVTCWTCREKGHKANSCPKKAGKKKKGQLKTAAAEGQHNAAAAFSAIEDRVNNLSEQITTLTNIVASLAKNV